MAEKNQNLSIEEQKEIDDAAYKAKQASDPALNVRTWLLENHRATLCTTSAKSSIEGYPFGSIVPFAIDANGKPYLMIAEIAAHTANLKNDSRAALMVSDPNAVGDPQASWRVTLIGTMKRIVIEGVDHKYKSSAVEVSLNEYNDLHRRYVERVPQAINYTKQHNFCYWRMDELITVRYIAGFGRICWIDGQEILRDPLGGGLDQSAQAAVDHMNEDHQENLIEMCEGLYGFKPKSAQMIGLDASGFQVLTEGPKRDLFFSFGKEIDAKSLRTAVINVLKKARTQLS